MKFGGRILYSQTSIEVEKAAKELLKNLELEKRESGQVVLGLDIEWRPTFKKGQFGAYPLKVDESLLIFLTRLLSNFTKGCLILGAGTNHTSL